MFCRHLYKQCFLKNDNIIDGKKLGERKLTTYHDNDKIIKLAQFGKIN